MKNKLIVCSILFVSPFAMFGMDLTLEQMISQADETFNMWRIDFKSNKPKNSAPNFPLTLDKVAVLLNENPVNTDRLLGEKNKEDEVVTVIQASLSLDGKSNGITITCSDEGACFTGAVLKRDGSPIKGQDLAAHFGFLRRAFAAPHENYSVIFKAETGTETIAGKHSKKVMKFIFEENNVKEVLKDSMKNWTSEIASFGITSFSFPITIQGKVLTFGAGFVILAAIAYWFNALDKCKHVLGR